MEIKLTVLQGGQKGTEIPIKKKKFVIGRSKECNLRAGSEAISRRHCILATDGRILVVKDLGSRNGTQINGKTIERKSRLRSGDELTVGPLRFRVNLVESKVASSSSEVSPAVEEKRAPEPTIISKAAPKKETSLKGVNSSVVAGDISVEEDISRWLLGEDPGVQAMGETQTIQMDETRSLPLGKNNESPHQATRAESVEESESLVPDTSDQKVISDEEAVADSETKSGLFSGLLGNKNTSKENEKKQPGKLPKIPNKNQSKDSCSAATDILREMTRRR